MQKRTAFLIGILSLIFVLSSCIESPEFKGASNFKIDEINKERIAFNVDIKTYNPNNKNINIRKSTLKLYLNDHFIGDAQLQKKYKMGKNMTTLDNVPVEVMLDKEVLFSLVRILTGNPVKLRLEGKLKTSVSGFPYNHKIDETTELDIKDLGINLRDLLPF